MEPGRKLTSSMEPARAGAGVILCLALLTVFSLEASSDSKVILRFLHLRKKWSSNSYVWKVYPLAAPPLLTVTAQPSMSTGMTQLSFVVCKKLHDPGCVSDPSDKIMRKMRPAAGDAAGAERGPRKLSVRVG